MSRSGRERAPTGSARSSPSATVRSMPLRHCAFPPWRWSGAEQSAAGLSLLLPATFWSRRRMRHFSPSRFVRVTFRWRAGYSGSRNGLAAPAPIGVRPRNAVDPAQRTRDILQRRQMAEQIELLEHHADADHGALIGQVTRRKRFAVFPKTHAAAADLDGSGIPALEMVDTSEQRALARPARAEQGNDFAIAHRHIDAGENRLAVIGLV